MWTSKNNTLMRTVVCTNFMEAVQHINDIAALAEAQGHHPNLTLRDYRYLDISLTTHDSGNTITDKDRTLADAIDRLLDPTAPSYAE